MSRRIGAGLAALLLVTCASTSPARTAEGGAASADAAAREDLASIAAAAEAHPDDVDLAWAAALAAADVDPADALARFERIVSGGGEPRRGRALALGRRLAERGRDAEALRVLEQAVSDDPRDAAAWLHHGLVSRRLGRLAEADASLARAAELEPALAPEVLLLRGLGQRARGNAAQAESLLRATIDVEPDGEAARRARLVLGDDAGPGEPWLSLFAEGGFQWDSNVTLDGRVQLGDEADRDDVAATWSSGIALRPIRGERVSLALGYRYDGSAYAELHDYDLGNHLAFASLLVRLGEGHAVRLDGLWDHARLGDARYGQTRTLRPNLFVPLGPELGVLRLYADVEQRSYYDEPLLSSLDRDGRVWGVGAEQTLPVPGWREATLTAGARYADTDTFADPDLLGFDDAYDHGRWEGFLRLEAPVLWEVRATTALLVASERYDAPNVVDFLTDDGVGSPFAQHRRDWVTEAAVSLVRPVFGPVAVEVGWRGTFRASNVDVYAYDRHVVGLSVRVFTD